MSRTVATLVLPSELPRNRAARATQRRVRFGHRTEPRGGARNTFREDLGDYMAEASAEPIEVPCAGGRFCSCASCEGRRAVDQMFAEWDVEAQMDSDWAADRGEDPWYWLDDAYAKYLEREFEAEMLEERARLEVEWVYGDLLGSEPDMLPMPPDEAFRQWGRYEVTGREAELIAERLAEDPPTALRYVLDPNPGGEILCVPGGAVLRAHFDVRSGVVGWYLHAYHHAGEDARQVLAELREPSALQ